MSENKSNLFCYGSLQVPEVIAAVIGRQPEGSPASLPGYDIFCVRAAEYPGAVANPQGTVPGIIYRDLTLRELELLDRFEGSPYERRLLSITSDRPAEEAWAYIIPPHQAHWLSDEPWTLQHFRESGLLERFLSRYVRG